MKNSSTNITPYNYFLRVIILIPFSRKLTKVSETIGKNKLIRKKLSREDKDLTTNPISVVSLWRELLLLLRPSTLLALLVLSPSSSSLVNLEKILLLLIFPPHSLQKAHRFQWNSLWKAQERKSWKEEGKGSIKYFF